MGNNSNPPYPAHLSTSFATHDRPLFTEDLVGAVDEINPAIPPEVDLGISAIPTRAKRPRAADLFESSSTNGNDSVSRGGGGQDSGDPPRGSPAAAATAGGGRAAKWMPIRSSRPPSTLAAMECIEWLPRARGSVQIKREVFEDDDNNWLASTPVFNGQIKIERDGEGERGSQGDWLIPGPDDIPFNQQRLRMLQQPATPSPEPEKPRSPHWTSTNAEPLVGNRLANRFVSSPTRSNSYDNNTGGNKKTRSKKMGGSRSAKHSIVLRSPTKRHDRHASPRGGVYQPPYRRYVSPSPTKDRSHNPQAVPYSSRWEFNSAKRLSVERGGDSRPTADPNWNMNLDQFGGLLHSRLHQMDLARGGNRAAPRMEPRRAGHAAPSYPFLPLTGHEWAPPVPTPLMTPPGVHYQQAGYAHGYPAAVLSRQSGCAEQIPASTRSGGHDYQPPAPQTPAFIPQRSLVQQDTLQPHQQGQNYPPSLPNIPDRFKRFVGIHLMSAEDWDGLARADIEASYDSLVMIGDTHFQLLAQELARRHMNQIGGLSGMKGMVDAMLDERQLVEIVALYRHEPMLSVDARVGVNTLMAYVGALAEGVREPEVGTDRRRELARWFAQLFLPVFENAVAARKKVKMDSEEVGSRSRSRRSEDNEWAERMSAAKKRKVF